MGILSRQAIERRLKSGEIKIDPMPSQEDFDSDSVDVHLGDVVYAWRKPPTGSTISVALWKPPPDQFELKPDMKVGQLTFWKVEEPGIADDIPERQFDQQQTARGD
ncbi:MAG TPA: hypothetical protein VNH11_18755 [Pirellulales bacterium]|nr:hypothetical protein [Pirellulales bacterium]